MLKNKKITLTKSEKLNTFLPQKRLTLVELIIVIVVIGVLAGMSIPKFTGVVKNARVAAMIRDTEVLEKALIVYQQDNDDIPLLTDDEDFVAIDDSIKLIKIVKAEEGNNDMDTIYESLQKTLEKYNDSDQELYRIDLSKTKDYLSKDIKYGHKKSDKDFYVYSKETGKIYYYGYLENDKGEYHHTIDPVSVENNKLNKRKVLALDSSSNQQNFEFIVPDWAKNIFDLDLSTGVGINPYGTYVLTWNGDLSNNILDFYASSAYSDVEITFLDENNKSVPSYNLKNKKYTSTHLLSRVLESNKLIAPKNAKKIKIVRGNNGSGSLREILIPKGPKTYISNFKAIENNYDAILNFETDSNFQSLFVFNDGVFLGETTTNSITLNRLCANTEYKLQLIALSKEDTIAGIYNYTIETQDDGVGFYIPKDKDNYYNLIDKNPNTIVYLKYDSAKPEVFLTKELGGKTLNLDVDGYYENITVQFYDQDNKLITSTQLKRDLMKTTKQVTIPNGTKKMRFNHNSINPAHISEIYIDN